MAIISPYYNEQYILADDPLDKTLASSMPRDKSNDAPRRKKGQVLSSYDEDHSALSTVAGKSRQREGPVRMSSEDKDVYLTPTLQLEDKVRTNVLGMVVPKKQRPITEDDTDGDNYTLARIEGHEDEVVQSSKPTSYSKKSHRNRGISEAISQLKCRKSVIAFIVITCILLVVIGILVFSLLNVNKSKYNITH